MSEETSHMVKDTIREELAVALHEIRRGWVRELAFHHPNIGALLPEDEMDDIASKWACLSKKKKEFRRMDSDRIIKVLEGFKLV
jgi:hypothetical protein